MTQPKRSSDVATPLSAILLIFGATFFFALADTQSKYLVLAAMPALFLSWIRFLGQAVLTLVLFGFTDRRRFFSARNWQLQLVRGLLLLISNIFALAGLRTMPLVDFVSVVFMSPLVITALSGPMLGEWAGWRRWSAILIGFVGVLVITRPGSDSFQMGHLYAFGSAASYSVFVILTRMLGATESAANLLLMPALIAVIALFPVVPFTWTLPTRWQDYAMLAGLGICSSAGHWLVIRAHMNAAASALAPYIYIQIVWSGLLGYLVFEQLPNRWTIFGTAIIVSSGLYLIYRERQLRLSKPIPTISP